MTLPEFVPFPKIPRLNREVVVTEKIDGTNAAVHVDDDGAVTAGSRTRWLTPEQDNFGFAKWVVANAEELRKLGPGLHHGEWWGSGIQRGYGLVKGEKRFSLFNVAKWADDAVRPACCSVVPSLVSGSDIRACTNLGLEMLRSTGSFAAQGFMNPEGVVVFHTASYHLYKVTLSGDESPKRLTGGLV